MSDAPERIWIEDEFGEGDDDQWTYGTWDVRNYMGYDVEYVRADIYRALSAVQTVTVRLVFSNAAATPKTTVLDVSAASVPDIMAWYGAYCAGDRYTVTMDGRNVPMDPNGEPIKGGDA